MTWFPEKRFGVAVFANAPNTHPERIAYEIANIYLNQPEPSKTQPKIAGGSPVTKPSGPVLTPELLTIYGGDYWSEELQVVYRVEIQNGKLMLGHRFSGWGKLLPTGLDRFKTEPRPGVPVAPTIEFTRDSASVVNGMKVTGGRVRNLWFTRVSLTRPESR